MTRVFVLFMIIVFLGSNSYAGERKWHMNLFNAEGSRIIPFHIAGVFCDRYNNIWGEKCQDALLEDLYGYIWPEVKEIILFPILN